MHLFKKVQGAFQRARSDSRHALYGDFQGGEGDYSPATPAPEAEEPPICSFYLLSKLWLLLKLAMLAFVATFILSIYLPIFENLSAPLVAILGETNTTLLCFGVILVGYLLEKGVKHCLSSSKPPQDMTAQLLDPDEFAELDFTKNNNKPNDEENEKSDSETDYSLGGKHESVLSSPSNGYS